MKKRLILHPRYGGLGDHLLFSHIPRIAKEQGYKKVFVSKKAPYRNFETKKFVWESNPYVDGFCDEEGIRFKEFSEVEKGANLLDKVMLLHGIDDDKRFHEPELYCPINRISQYTKTTLFDPNYISNAGKLNIATILSFFDKNKIIIHNQFATNPNWKNFVLDGIPFIRTKDIFEYASILLSCKDIYCLTTGTATLAAALGKKATVLYGNGVLPMAHHSKLHTYINLNEIL